VDLEKALESQDFQSIQRIGHTLKGVAGSYGFEVIGAYGSEIEEAATRREVSSIRQNLERITDFLQNMDIVYV